MPIKVGHKLFNSADDIPEIVPLFPIRGALLLPLGQLPLNIFETKYLEMFDNALSGNRLIGIIQPAFADKVEHDGSVEGDAHGVGGQDEPTELCASGCVGRIISWTELEDGQCAVTLMGIMRFDLIEELAVDTSYRQAKISCDPYLPDLDSDSAEETVNREELLTTFRNYLEANDLEANWESINSASTSALVNALSMMSPFGPAEKQALLEAPDLKTRAETLNAITEMDLARKEGSLTNLQ